MMHPPIPPKVFGDKSKTQFKKLNIKSETGCVHRADGGSRKDGFFTLCNHCDANHSYEHHWLITKDSITCRRCLAVLRRKAGKERMTVGYRCKIIRSTDPEEVDREVLLAERQSGRGSFSVLVLSENGIALRKSKKVVGYSMAWVEEENMEIVNRNVSENLDFIDWYETQRYGCE